MSAAIFRDTPPRKPDPILKIEANCARMRADRLEIKPDGDGIRVGTCLFGRPPMIICLNLEDAKLVSRGLAELIKQIEAE